MNDRPALLVDGRNCMYRAIFANKGERGGVRYSSFVLALRFINTWVERFTPDQVHVFWDADRETVWRRKILPTYKDRPPAEPEIAAELDKTQAAAKELFGCLNIRQYERISMEADDLIYAFCRVVIDKPLVIVSSDGDFTQIPYHLQHVQLFEPRLNQIVARPEVDPVIQKALMGDDGDVVKGYQGIGPVKSKNLAGSLAERHQFLEQRGKKQYIRNRMLVDLSLCPYVLSNILYIEKVLVTSKPTFDKAMVLEGGKKHRLNGLYQDYERLCLRLASLGDPANIPQRS